MKNYRASRRSLLAAAATAAALPGCGALSKSARSRGVQRGRIRQSVVQWCFADHWELEETCRHAAALGCKSVELVGPEDWPTLHKHGLTCAIAPNGMDGPPFVRGFNNPAYHDMVIDRTRQMIDRCAEADVPSVIAFTGFKWRDADDPAGGEIGHEEGIENCVAGFRKILPHAERKNVAICLEMLNSRDATEMKGHPGYQGDHTDYCMEIIRRVGSPRLKLLFDIYHVQIMDGDVIRRIRELRGHIGHIHTAGNPGRGELDDNQEINYPPILRALLEVGYTGYIGQEFIPTRDPYEGLAEAVGVCDV